MVFISINLSDYVAERMVFYTIVFLNRATGFASAKIGRLAAFTIGGAIILLEVANEQGIIKIDWSRLYRKVDEAGDKVQEQLTGEGPKWMDKVSLPFVFAHKCSSIYIFH